MIRALMAQRMSDDTISNINVTSVIGASVAHSSAVGTNRCAVHMRCLSDFIHSVGKRVVTIGSWMIEEQLRPSTFNAVQLKAPPCIDPALFVCASTSTGQMAH